MLAVKGQQGGAAAPPKKKLRGYGGLDPAAKSNESSTKNDSTQALWPVLMVGGTFVVHKLWNRYFPTTPDHGTKAEVVVKKVPTDYVWSMPSPVGYNRG